MKIEEYEKFPSHTEPSLDIGLNIKNVGQDKQTLAFWNSFSILNCYPYDIKINWTEYNASHIFTFNCLEEFYQVKLVFDEMAEELEKKGIVKSSQEALAWSYDEIMKMMKKWKEDTANENKI